MLFATVTWLDVVLVVMLITSIGFGFLQGLLRQLFILVAMYIATVLAAQYHRQLADAIQAAIPASSAEMARLTGFLVLLVLFTLVVTWLIWTAYRETRLPSVVMLDEATGTVLGCIIGIFAVNLTLLMVRYAVDAPWPDESNVKQFLHAGLANSYLQSALSSPMPLIHAALRPWLPDGIPMLLDG